MTLPSSIENCLDDYGQAVKDIAQALAFWRGTTTSPAAA